MSPFVIPPQCVEVGLALTQRLRGQIQVDM